MQQGKKAAAIGPTVWSQVQEENKKLVLSQEVIYPIAYSSDGTPYMDDINLEETGKTEEVSIDLPVVDKDGKNGSFTVKVTLVEYKYTPVKGEPQKWWFPLAPDQKSLITLLEQNLAIQKLAKAMKDYVDITLGTNPAIINAGIPEIGLSHALSLTGNEITKEVEELMVANLRGSMSPSDANKEIINQASKISKNYINSQFDAAHSISYIKAIKEVIKLLKDRNIDLTSTTGRQVQSNIGTSNMTAVVVDNKISPDVNAIDNTKRSEQGSLSKVNLF